jgi:hypothetical protein
MFGGRHLPVGSTGIVRWTALLALAVSVPASLIGAVVAWEAAAPPLVHAGAVAVALSPVLLGFLIGRRAWPQDEDRWAATVRALLACGTLWVGGVIFGALFYINVVSGSHVITPALIAGAVVYGAITLGAGRDGDFAFATWPLAVVAGLAAIVLVTAAGPHGYCVT